MSVSENTNQTAEQKQSQQRRDATRKRQAEKIAAMQQKLAAKPVPGTPPTAPARQSKSPPVIRLACVHEGAVIAPCSSCQGESRHVRDCELHGTCTRGEAGKDVDRVCATCSDYAPISPAKS